MAGKKEPVEINRQAEMSEEKREVLRGLLTAFYDAMAEFDSDHKVIFGSDAERNRVHFRSRKRWGRAWSKPGRCMHDGCTKRSITRSHTISLGTSLRLIAENGHVMTPQLGKNGLELVPIGIKKASTFPGFCKEHEGQFAGFEAKKAMTGPEHFRLQAFRTICRELYTMRHHRQKLEEGLAEYRLLREDFVVGRIKQALTRPKHLYVSGLRFENDPIEARAVKALKDIRIGLLELERLYCGILDDLQNGGNNLAIMEYNFDIQLAVCLSGRSVLAYMANGVPKLGLCFLAILPEVGQTKIMLGAAAEHKDAVRMVFRDESSPAFLETLESWMIHCSDHWFMTPSAWAAIPHGRRRAICDCVFEPLSLVDRAPFSVLDGPRRYIVTYIERQLASGAIPPEEITGAQEIIAHERAKLDYVPPIADTA